MNNQKSDLAYLPNYIYCSVTGAKLSVRREVLVQRIKEAGSLERLQKTYISRDVRRLMTKEGKSIEEVRKILGCDPEHANMDLIENVAKTSSSLSKARISYENQDIDTFWRSWKFDQKWDQHPITPEQIQQTTVDVCLIPNKYLDKNCPACRYFSDCRCDLKENYKKR